MRRRVRYHVTIGLVSGGGGALVYAMVGSPDVKFRLSMATAYVGTALLAWTLLLGPLRILRQRRSPTSTDVRRDVGIWAAIVTVAHVVVGLQRHFSGRMLRYFVYAPDQFHLIPLRHDPFGLANWAGLLGGLLVLVLLGISNDMSLRRLGAKRWKSLQRWNYVLFGLTAFHGLLYQLVVEDRPWPFVVMLVSGVGVTIAMQLAGFRARRRWHAPGQ